MAQRNRKRGQRERPATAPRPAAVAIRTARPEAEPAAPGSENPSGSPLSQDFLERYRARTEAQNAAARATLEPLAPGERPWPLKLSIALATLAGVGNLIAFAAGAKIAGKHPAAGGIILFSVVMVACAIGMWRLWYQAVLAFMALLGIMVILFSLFLIEASNLLGVLVPPVFIGVGGYLFWKLVRVLGRLQMPERPAR